MKQKLPIPSRERWTAIDEALYGPKDLYMIDPKEADQLRFHAIQESINHHYNHNQFYRTLCKQRDFTPKDVQTIADVPKIPLIPDTMFKGYPEPPLFTDWLRGIISDDITIPKVMGASYGELIDRLNEQGLFIIFSSGSTGRHTFVPVDPITFAREKYIRRDELYSEPHALIHLGPNMLNSNWSYLFSLNNYRVPLYQKDLVFLGMNTPRVTPEVFQTKFLTRERIEDGFTKVISLLENLTSQNISGIFHSSPIMLSNFLSFLEGQQKRFTLGSGWFVETGGGSKKNETGTFSLQNLTIRIESVFGIPKENYRDLYAMSECRAVFPTCEGQYKHVPYTVLHPFVLDENLDPIGFNEPGRFAFIDTLAHSYPGFIITGDRVKLLENCPACNRPGPVLDPEISRISGVEDKGCANLVRRLMAEETARI